MDGDLAMIMIVPLTAIVMGVGSKMVKTWTQHEREMALLNVSRRGELNSSSQQELETLRAEIAQLRDTTTKYDLSVDKALQEIQARLNTVEQRTRPSNPVSYVPTPAQEETRVQPLGTQQL